MDDNNSFIVTNKTSGLIANLTDLGFASFTDSTDFLEVTSGKVDSSTSSGKESNTGTTDTVMIRDGATDETIIQFSGLTKNSKSASKVNTSGVHSVKSSGSVAGSGVGLFGGNDAVVQGKLTGSGSGKETVVE
jgi:hypothetical protein